MSGCATKQPLDHTQYDMVDNYQLDGLTLFDEYYELTTLSLALPVEAEEHYNLLYPLFFRPMDEFTAFDEDLALEDKCYDGEYQFVINTNADDANYKEGSPHIASGFLKTNCIDEDKAGLLLFYEQVSQGNGRWDAVADVSQIIRPMDAPNFYYAERTKSVYVEIDEESYMDLLIMEDLNLQVASISESQYQLSGTITHLVSDDYYTPQGVVKINILEPLVLEPKELANKDSSNAIVGGKVEVLGKNETRMVFEFDRWTYRVSTNGAAAKKFHNTL